MPPGGRDCWLPHDFGCWTLLAARWWSGVDNNNNNNRVSVDADGACGNDDCSGGDGYEGGKYHGDVDDDYDDDKPVMTVVMVMEVMSTVIIVVMVISL